MSFKTIIKKGQFQFEKNKGLIFTILSAGFEIAAIVAMAKQAPKAEKVLVPSNKKITKLKEEMKDTEAIANKLVNVNDHKKEIKKIQRATFKSLVKIYSVPVIFTGLSLTFMGTSYKVMRDKQIAIGAAYITLENAFKSYRNRVKEKVGQEIENEIYRDIRDVKITRQIEDPETGELKNIEETIKRSYSGGPYELWFDAASVLFSRSGRTNYETLMIKWEEANNLLKMNGYLFLFDVIDILQIPKSTISKDLLIVSKSVGWIYDEFDSSKQNWIDFGICNQDRTANEIGKELLDNIENTVLLSFNPDGNILLDKAGNSFVDYIKD